MSPGTQITEEEVRHIASLARLQLSDTEISSYTEELTKIVGFVEQLNQLDFTGLEQNNATSADHLGNYREDVVLKQFERETLLKNAPDEEDGFFRVPRILDDATKE